MKKKLLVMLVAATACCSFGCGGDHDEYSFCVNNVKRCNGNDLQVCANNNWLHIQTCNHGCDAINKECQSDDVGETCNVGEQRCDDGNNLKFCTGDGWSYVTCSNGCNIEKNDCFSADETAKCQSGEQKCAGDKLLICSNGEWIATNCSNGCDAAKNECKSGNAGSVCENGAKTCDQENNTIKQCSDNKWIVIETCPGQCSPETNACIAECQNSERQCYGNNLRVCFDSKWEVRSCAHGCDTEKKECYSSAPGVTCSNGEKRCTGSTLQTCASSAWQNSEDCEYGCDPIKNECKPKPGAPACSDEEKRCNGKTLQSCSNGKWQDSQNCDYGCDTEKKECIPEGSGSSCASGDVRCNGNNLLLCLYGNWVHGEMCDYGCDSVNKTCKSEPSVAKKCAPGVTNANCTPNCEEDGSKGYYWQGSRVETVACPIDEGCKVDGSRVKCVPRILEDCTYSSKTVCKSACSYFGSEGYYWSLEDGKVKVYECHDNKRCKIDDIGHVKCVPIETGTPCTLMSTEACDAACSADRREGYYWSSFDNAVTVYTCYGDTRCMLDPELRRVYCDIETCTSESTLACKPACSPDNTEAYFWSGVSLIVNDCAAESKKCVMSGGKALCMATSGEACDPQKDKPICAAGNAEVKYCSQDAKEYILKDCPQCYVEGDTFFCNGDQNLKDCTSSSTEKCKGACENDTRGWRWDRNTDRLVQFTCKVGTTCSASKTGWLSCI